MGPRVMLKKKKCGGEDDILGDFIAVGKKHSKKNGKKKGEIEAAALKKEN